MLIGISKKKAGRRKRQTEGGREISRERDRKESRGREKEKEEEEREEKK